MNNDQPKLVKNKIVEEGALVHDSHIFTWENTDPVTGEVSHFEFACKMKVVENPDAFQERKETDAENSGNAAP
jgi:hypothetical protein